MQFNVLPYTNTFDKAYYYPVIDLTPEERLPVPEQEQKETIHLTPKQVGVSLNPFAHPIQALQEKIREGASRVEFGFFGAGKGNAQQFTPEAIGKTEREMLRNLAEINEVKSSTHATVATGSLAGFDGQRGEFSDEMRMQSLKEIAKAIDFAADATHGGPVVVHLQEFPRPITKLKGFRPFGLEGKEKEKELIIVADKEKGKIQAVRRDIELYEPEMEKVYNPLTGEYEERPKFKNGQLVMKKLTYDDVMKIEREKDPNVHPDVAFLKHYYTSKMKELEAESLRYSEEIKRVRERLEKIRKALKYYQELKQKLPPEKWNIFKKVAQTDELGVLPPEVKDPVEYLKEKEKDYQSHLQHMEKYIEHYQEQLERMKSDIYDEKGNLKIVPVEEVALEKTSDTIARAALIALEKTRQKKHLKQPLFIAPENIFPETYGSHPEELEKIILASRKKMVEFLKQRGYSEAQAKELAKKHIKATLDVAHMNLWRKYFKPPSPNMKPEDVDKAFNKWFVKQVEKLAEKGIVGHVHLSDNFGFDDEHLSLGQGTVPLKDLIKALKKSGVKDMIVEVGSFNPRTGLHDAWRFLGTPLYRVAKPATFGMMSRAHYGYIQPPFYIVGAYAPSNEWKLWSEVPLE
ncbi:hypothetical protein J7L02_03955 [Candidatus Woesearchaeota archaeon]|nr:hypothetical protein [Candidatus Woesearchaeota archaeon]